MRDIFPRSKLLWANRCSHLTSSFLACSCSSLGHSSRPYRFSPSRIQSFQGSWAVFLQVLKQSSIWGELGCNSPYLAVSQHMDLHAVPLGWMSCHECLWSKMEGWLPSMWYRHVPGCCLDRIPWMH